MISTPPKCGANWTQMLCALLIFDGPDVPAPLDEMSPWLDMSNRPLLEVTAALAAQINRGFIKMYTPSMVFRSTPTSSISWPPRSA